MTTSHLDDHTFDSRWVVVDPQMGSPLAIYTLLEEVALEVEPLHANLQVIIPANTPYTLSSHWKYFSFEVGPLDTALILVCLPHVHTFASYDPRNAELSNAGWSAYHPFVLASSYLATDI